MARTIESYTKKMVYITSNGWEHLLDQTCYRCTLCGEKWEPTFYGEDGRWWDGSWNHRCPKAPMPVPPSVPAQKVESFDFDLDF